MLYILILLVLLHLLIISYIAYQRYEELVCDEQCAIYCNTFFFNDQLCGVNNEIMTSLHKFCLKNVMKGEQPYHLEKKMSNEIIVRNKIERLKNNYVHMAFQPLELKTIVLFKHKIINHVIQPAIALAEYTEMEFIEKLGFLLKFLTSETRYLLIGYFNIGDCLENDHFRILVKCDLSAMLQKIFADVVERQREIME